MHGMSCSAKFLCFWLFSVAHKQLCPERGAPVNQAVLSHMAGEDGILQLWAEPLLSTASSTCIHTHPVNTIRSFSPGCWVTAWLSAAFLLPHWGLASLQWLLRVHFPVELLTEGQRGKLRVLLGTPHTGKVQVCVQCCSSALCSPPQVIHLLEKHRRGKQSARSPQWIQFPAAIITYWNCLSLEILFQLNMALALQCSFFNTIGWVWKWVGLQQSEKVTHTLLPLVGAILDQNSCPFTPEELPACS